MLDRTTPVTRTDLRTAFENAKYARGPYARADARLLAASGSMAAPPRAGRYRRRCGRTGAQAAVAIAIMVCVAGLFWAGVAALVARWLA